MKKAAVDIPETIDAYIAGFPKDVQQRLQKVRAAIRKAAPAAEDSISYRIAAFKLGGKPLLYFAAFKAHIGLYPMTGGVKEAFASELAPFEHSKGTVRFPLDRPVPYGLIGRIARFKVREAAAKAKQNGKKAGKKKPAD
ncbi:MAG: DUF1801 domain-containing protein [Hyphomicrobium sp.]